MALIVFALLCTFLVQGSVQESNSTSLQGKQIQDFYREHFSYLVALRKSDKQYCSGFVIATYKVLTAAYCMHEEAESRDFSEIIAVIGMNEYQIDSGVIDECYKNTNTYPQSDYGILKLKEPAHVREAVLPNEIDQDYYPPPGGVTLLIQWDKLRCGDMKAVVIEGADRETCAQHFMKKGETFMDDLICAEPEDKRESVDEINIGSPLFQNTKVIGILSGGSLQDKGYFIFTNLYKFTPHLKKAKSSNPTLPGLQSYLRKTTPYLVSLRKSDQHYCSGVVIALYKILTSAYCICDNVQSQNFSEIRAVIEFNEFEIDSGMTDDCFNNTNSYPQYDFGILTLKEPADIMKAVVPDETEADHYPSPGGVMLLIKWDSLYRYDMKAVVIESADRETCAEYFIERGENFMDDLICADFEDKREFIQRADIGSPLIQNEKVIGILSGGSWKNREYIIFTNLFEYTSYTAEAKSKSEQIRKKKFGKSGRIGANHRDKIQKIF